MNLNMHIHTDSYVKTHKFGIFLNDMVLILVAGVITRSHWQPVLTLCHIAGIANKYNYKSKVIHNKNINLQCLIITAALVNRRFFPCKAVIGS